MSVSVRPRDALELPGDAPVVIGERAQGADRLRRPHRLLRPRRADDRKGHRRQEQGESTGKRS